MNQKRPVIVGHRGAASLEPENTWVSFQRAVTDGAETIELDVHLSKDGEVVVHHDETVDRTAVRGRTTGKIAELTYAELQEVGLAFGQRIMKLEEVLEKTKLPIYVEIKAAAATAPTLKLVRKLGAANRVTFISFLPEVIQEIRAAEPGWDCALIATIPDEKAKATIDEVGGSWASFGIYELSAADVEREHAAGRKVNVWTVSTLDQVRRLLKWGVDSISSDNPGWLKWAIQKLEKENGVELSSGLSSEAKAALLADYKKFTQAKEQAKKAKNG